ncbi:MAG: dephospho-CoA kinase [Pseudomonadales bacterium]|nr:dephospho-CoA kinase [Pseudomonadales bacterium]
MSFVVGLTGGIGSGKTAVSDAFEALGITIADADVASRTVVEPGRPALAQIVSHFGESILQADGTLDRARLRKIVFTDAGERKILESVTVPAIMRELTGILERSTSPYAMLMLSSGGGRSPLVQRNLVVDVPEDVQVARVTARDDNTPEQVRAIMAAQPSREQRLAYADDVIENTGTLDELKAAVARLHRQYLDMAGKHG